LKPLAVVIAMTSLGARPSVQAWIGILMAGAGLLTRVLT
jgi:uncharacterized membrane protein